MKELSQIAIDKCLCAFMEKSLQVLPHDMTLDAFQRVVGKLKSKAPNIEADTLKKKTENKDSEVETTEILDRME